MTRMVKCIKLGRDAEGLDLPPYPGELGKRIYENVSKEAWQAWIKHQTMLINENKLNLATRVRGNISPSRWRSISSDPEPTWLPAMCHRTSKRFTSGRSFSRPSWSRAGAHRLRAG